MADLNQGKGKFYGVDSNVPYSGTFTGASKLAQKVKVGGSENKPDGYVVDAIDIDWGGLKLTTITPEWGTDTISSSESNAGKCNSTDATDNTAGIKSSGFLLEKISDSLSAIREFIGHGNNIDNDYKDALSYNYDDDTNSYNYDNVSEYTVTGKLADALDKIDDINEAIGEWFNTYNRSMSSVIGDWQDTTYSISEAISDIQHILGDASSVDEIVSNIDAIKAELEGAPMNSWTTLVDKLDGLGDETVASYVSNAIDDALAGFSTEPDWSYVIGSDEDDDENSETIYGAKKYADDVAASAAYAVLGDRDNDTADDDTVYGAKAYTADVRDELYGRDNDGLDTSSYTICGVVNYAKELSTTIDNITLAGFNVQRIEENNEGILVFTDINSYLNPQDENPGESPTLPIEETDPNGEYDAD